MNAAPCSWRVVTWRTVAVRRQRVEDVHRLLAGHGEDVLAALGGEAVDEQVGGGSGRAGGSESRAECSRGFRARPVNSRPLSASHSS